MDEYKSSHTIIKALKGAKDPPGSSTFSKIEIARNAWEDAELRFPNKDEFVVDWLLSNFVKDRENTRSGMQSAPA